MIFGHILQTNNHKSIFDLIWHQYKMIQYNRVKVTLSNLQLDELKSATKMEKK